MILYQSTGKKRNLTILICQFKLNQTQIIKDLNVDNEKNEIITKLQKLCEEKDSQLHSIQNNMKSDLLLKDGKIASLETLCKEKDCQLNSLQNLKQDLIIKDERLTQLERLCKDKDNQLSSLQNILILRIFGNTKI